VLGGVTFNAKEAVVANDADVAVEAIFEVSERDADKAYDAEAILPNKNEAVTAFVAFDAVIVKLLILLPVPSVSLLPEICTRSS
jgi:hypothetical protein